MKANKALAMSAAIQSQVDAARLNHKLVDPALPPHDPVNVFNPANAQINMIDVVRGLDDDARARLQEALDSAKG